ncbi:hypothetical protein E4U22_006912 [Claviceps purpurea]|nr:hypothetical protein E4U22_006912 [Claviceps purpurea]
MDDGVTISSSEEKAVTIPRGVIEASKERSFRLDKAMIRWTLDSHWLSRENVLRDAKQPHCQIIIPGGIRSDKSQLEANY